MLDAIGQELPPPRGAAGKTVDYWVNMRDGVRLMTHVYFPRGEGPWPVILIRNPYIEAKGTIPCQIFVKYGYVVVYQECRGRGSSEGDWEPFVNERLDGLDTLDWLVRQKWQDGNIGMFGHSYLSFTQWVIADALPPQVKTLFLSGFGTERYRQMYMGGMFRHEIYTSWAIENSGITTVENKGEIYQKAIRVRPHIEMDRQLLGEELPWYRSWVTQVAADSPLWKKGLWADLQKIPGKIQVPIHLIAGWFDHHLDGMVRAYQNLSEATRKQSRAVIGPWAHSLNPEGDLEYPNHRTIGIRGLKAALEWFDYRLQGKPMNQRVGVIETYRIGKGRWETWENWPPRTEPQNFYLQQPGTPEYPGGVLTCYHSEETTAVSFRSKPDNPVPTKGGSALLAWMSPKFQGAEPGSVIQPPPGFREDVLTFLSGPLPEELLITGRIKVWLCVSSEAEDSAFAVKVMEVFSNGKTYNIADGITSLALRNGAAQPRRYQPDEPVKLKIELWPITWCIQRGSQVRLDIAASNFPAYHVHANLAGSWVLQKDTKVAVQTIFIGGGNRTFVEMPVASHNCL